MSMMGMGDPTASSGEIVASYPKYEAAQKAVSTLIAANVPAKEIAIVGLGLRSVERVTGRLGYGSAARAGAMNGVLLGLLFGAFTVFANPDAPIQLFVGVMFVGIAVGMLLSLLSFLLVRRRRDFASVMQVVADHYEVRVQPSSIHMARQALGTAQTRPATRQPDLSEPPRYGERIVPGAPASGTDPAHEGSAES